MTYNPGWWDEAFPRLPADWKGPGNRAMLIVIAYDITRPKRLRKVAELCESYGQRVQYSVFECHLDAASLDQLWSGLCREINPSEDRIVAYVIDAKGAAKTRTAGEMVCAESSLCYLV